MKKIKYQNVREYVSTAIFVSGLTIVGISEYFYSDIMSGEKYFFLFFN